MTGEVANIAAVSPEVLDKIDFDQAVDELALIAGVSARIVRSDAEVEELRANRQKKAQEQQAQARVDAALPGLEEVLAGLEPLLQGGMPFVPEQLVAAAGDELNAAAQGQGSENR